MTLILELGALAEKAAKRTDAQAVATLAAAAAMLVDDKEAVEYAARRRGNDRDRKRNLRKSADSAEIVGTPSPLPSSSFPTPNITTSFPPPSTPTTAREGDAAVVAELSITATYLAIWANGAITERWGESPNPLTVTGHAVQLADKLVAGGVDPTAARASIYRQCRISKKDRPPLSVNYFANGIEEDWQRELARRALHASGERPPARGEKMANGRGEAALTLARIKALAQAVPNPGHGVRTTIPRSDVAKLGPLVVIAYDAIGGASRVLEATGEQWGFLTRDFAAALEAAGRQA